MADGLVGHAVDVGLKGTYVCLAEAAAPSDSLIRFWAPCTNILTYLLTHATYAAIWGGMVTLG